MSHKSHKKTSRQISALERTSRNIEEYKHLLTLDMVELNLSKGRVVQGKDEVKKTLKEKISKAETCIENLKAKGVTLGEK